MKHEIIVCPICRDIAFEPISNKGRGFDDTCQVVICKNDGLVFLSPRWTQEVYEDYYKEQYDEMYRYTLLKNTKQEPSYKPIQGIVKRLDGLGILEKCESMLDVGAGMGWGLDYVENEYPNIKKLCAIEMSAVCVDRLMKNEKIDLVAENFNDDWNTDPVDFILLRHVLEHSPNPVNTLVKCRESLTDEGYIFVSVPDMMKPKSSLGNYWFRVAHTFYFSENTLMKVAARAGLCVVHLFPGKHEIFMLLQKDSSAQVDLPNIYQQQKDIIENYR